MVERIIDERGKTDIFRSLQRSRQRISFKYALRSEDFYLRIACVGKFFQPCAIAEEFRNLRETGAFSGYEHFARQRAYRIETLKRFKEHFLPNPNFGQQKSVEPGSDCFL